MPVVVSEADKNDAVKNAFSALRDERKPQDYSEAERERMAVARLRLRALYQREIEPGYADIRYQAPDGTFFPLSEEDLRTMDERQTSDCQWREEMAFPCQAEQLIAGKEQAAGGYLQGERELTLAMLAPYAGGDTVPLLPPEVWQAANQMDTRERAFVKDDIFDRPGAVSMRCFGPLPHLAPWALLRPGLTRLKPQTAPVLPPDIAAARAPDTWIAASTHPGEDQIVLAAHRIVQQTLPHARLILAPRHPERRDSIAQYIRDAGYAPRLRSRGETARDSGDIYLLDTLGELKHYYRISGLAYIGGSLIPHGGHNPLEALHAGIPVIFGRSMYNFQHIRDALIHQPFARELADARPETLVTALLALHAEPHTAAIRAYMAPYHDIVAAHQQHVDALLNEQKATTANIAET